VIFKRLGKSREVNVVPLRDLTKLLDPLYTQAHLLLDAVPRDELWRLLPILDRAAIPNTAQHALLKAVGKKISRPHLPFELQAALALGNTGRRRSSIWRLRAACIARDLVAGCFRRLHGWSRREHISKNKITEDAVYPRLFSSIAGQGTVPFVQEREAGHELL
jgi:hypothetical protein